MVCYSRVIDVDIKCSVIELRNYSYGWYTTGINTSLEASAFSVMIIYVCYSNTAVHPLERDWGCCTFEQHRSPVFLDDGSFTMPGLLVCLLPAAEVSKTVVMAVPGGAVGKRLYCCMMSRFSRASASPCSEKPLQSLAEHLDLCRTCDQSCPAQLQRHAWPLLFTA